MPMQLKPIEDLDSPGSMILEWGPTKSGKTANALISAPKPLAIINVEGRDVRLNLKWIIEKGLCKKSDFMKVDYSDIGDCVEFLSTSTFDDFSSILFDSVTYLMQVPLSEELAMQAWEEREKKKGESSGKVLVGQTKMSAEAYGALSKQTIRIFKRLADLSKIHGKTVICTARDDTKPNWDNESSGGPLFEGNAFNKVFDGMCDAIGYVELRYEKGKPVWPPRISFDDPERRGFKCGWTGSRPVDKDGNDKALYRMPLDFELILRTMRGE